MPEINNIIIVNKTLPKYGNKYNYGTCTTAANIIQISRNIDFYENQVRLAAQIIQ